MAASLQTDVVVNSSDFEAAVTMSCPKWLPKDLQSSYHLFDEMSRAIVTFRMLTNRFLININVPDLYVSILQTVF